MKSNFLLIGAMFMFLTFSTSCSSDDDGGSGGGGTAAAGTISAKVDGSNIKSSTMLTFGTRVSQGSANTLTIQGTDNSGKGFNFIINGYEGEGTYDFGGANLIAVVGNYIEANASNPLDTQTWTAPYDNDSVRGSITVSSDSGDNVQGTFEFTCKNPNDDTIKDITDGAFNVDYQTF